MADHARMSPSAFYRYRLCPASYHLPQEVETPSSPAAELGTAAHYYLEARLDGEAPELPWPAPNGVEVDHHTADKVEQVLDWLQDWIRPRRHAQLFSEVRVPIWRSLGLTEDIIWGTADILVYDPDEDHLLVLDYKNGRTPVEVEGNDQLHLYALGALAFLDKSPRHVTLAIGQPETGQPVSSLSIDRLDAEFYQEEVARIFHNPEEFNPGEKQCFFCPGNGVCRASAEQALAVAEADFGLIEAPNPEALTNEELARIQDNAKLLRGFLDAVENHIKARLEIGQTVPHYKLVPAQGRRKYVGDLEEIKKLATAHKIKIRDITRQTPIGITELRKLLKGTDLFDVFTYVPEGKPKVVRDEDDRPAIASDFEVV